MAVDPARLIEMARDLAKGVLELVNELPANLDGGSVGYIAGSVGADAQALLEALSDAP